MTQMLIMYQQPVDPAAFDAYYFETHVPIFAQSPGIRSVTFNQGPIGALAGANNVYLVAQVTFDSMDDFSPAAVARKVDSLNKLLSARTQLANLLTYMDGKGKAEDLIGKLLQDPELLKSLAAAPKPEEPAAS